MESKFNSCVMFCQYRSGHTDLKCIFGVQSPKDRLIKLCATMIAKFDCLRKKADFPAGFSAKTLGKIYPFLQQWYRCFLLN